LISYHRIKIEKNDIEASLMGTVAMTVVQESGSCYHSHQMRSNGVCCYRTIMLLTQSCA